jgi:hypothetical protein
MYVLLLLFTAIGFAPGDSSPTLVQTKTIKHVCMYVSAYGLFHNVLSSSDYERRMVEWLSNNELQRMFKETVMV